MKFCLLLLLCILPLSAQNYGLSNERPPAVTREFRAAWVATIYNIDWPTKKGLSAASQQAEARKILDKLVSLKMNAVILQVRPHADALYSSSLEPWSPWLTGTMGVSPGYDPLAYWIEQGHARGIEIHAWFNPFRALSNTSHSCSGNHISRTKPHVIKKYGSMLWCDPALPDTRSHALSVILDVVRRYDIDGVHLDDYFYPYPSGNLRFNDGKSPSQRRAYVDGFVSQLYSAVKKQKPWVRVGISPFGIWRPGVPSGIEAGVDSYEDLAADSRKWLKNGWVDYLAPQLYWRISPSKQSYSALLQWWRQQGSRPVWPGIATTRIHSSDDPGRPASEIINQISLSRTIGKNWVGHIHWSMAGLMKNQGGISDQLPKAYTQAVAVPPMPWLSKATPPTPKAGASISGDSTSIRWLKDNAAAKIAVQARYGNTWYTVAVVPSGLEKISIRAADAVALSSLDRFGNISAPKVLGKN
ncbi:glycoside hydrolase family 10 protein [Luteolibacter sp. AS25]|uniref:glycoside hydrolase family 10 protein n=1 Tax=Luteolibacter sp. AS25 TaxID=3135776 RepID=UPI00398AC3B8